MSNDTLNPKDYLKACRDLSDAEQWDALAEKSLEFVSQYPNLFSSWHTRASSLYADFKVSGWVGNPDPENLEKQVLANYADVQNAFDKIVGLASSAYDKSELVGWARDIEDDIKVLQGVYEEAKREFDLLERQYRDRTTMMERYSEKRKEIDRSSFLAKRKLEKEAAEIKAELDAMPDPEKDEVIDASNNVLAFAVKKACITNTFNRLVEALDSM